MPATTVNAKMNAKDLKTTRALAKKWADGNVSAWLREAALKYKPKKKVVTEYTNVRKTVKVKAKKK